MTRILKQEIKFCNQCIYLRRMPVQEEGFEYCAINKFEYFCAMNHYKTINIGIETIDNIPEWCPLPHKEPDNKYYKGLVYHEQ